jgi:hypothetical protein
MQIGGRGTFVAANLDGAWRGCKHVVSFYLLGQQLSPLERGVHATGAQQREAAPRIDPAEPGSSVRPSGASAYLESPCSTRIS